MSLLPHEDPACHPGGEPAIELEIAARPRRITEDLTVRRLLPSAARRMVGPFVFLDHMGPVALPAGQGFDVPPHPHIGLATVTYLFDGELQHRDSLGVAQVIRAGDLNWMSAGRGIAHSERSTPEARQAGARMHGLQLWAALPAEAEEEAPSFQHHPAASLPLVERDGAWLRLIAGSAYGATSPVEVRSPLFYAEARLEAGAALQLPDEHAERAAYVVEGTVACGAETRGPGVLLVARPGAALRFVAREPARLMLLGGAPLGQRHIWWNFVSSRPALIEQAKRDWRDGRFALIPGDSDERIPLPE